MSSSTNPQDPYGTGDGPQQPDHSSGSTPPPPPMYGSGSTPPPYGSDPNQPAYGSTPPAYGSQSYGSTPGAYGADYGSGPSQYGSSYPKNSLGVWSLVLSIVGFLFCGLFTAIPGLIVGYKARRAVAEGQANNGGLALAGIVISWVTIALWVLLLLWLFAFGGLAWYMSIVEQSTTTTSF